MDRLFNSINLNLSIKLLLILIRIFFIFYFTPIFNFNRINKKINFLITCFISFVICPNISFSLKILRFSDLVICIFNQFIIGMIIGLSIYYIFSSILFSGDLISSQMGLSFSIFFDPNYRFSLSSISRLLYVLFLLFFFSQNIHLYIIYLIFQSFKIFPISNSFLKRDFFYSIVFFCKSVFVNGIIISFPIFFSLLIIQISFFILNKFVPQISYFSVFLSCILISGIYFFYLSLPIFFPIFYNLFNFKYFSGIFF